MGWLVALVLGGLGLGGFWRRRRRKERDELEVSPADELRSKLADARAAEAEAEPAAPEAEPELEDELARRRREVHDRARGAIDDLS